MSKTYPLHHTYAEPLYVTIPQKEYDRLLKVDREWKELQDAFHEACMKPAPLYPHKICPSCGRMLDEK